MASMWGRSWQNEIAARIAAVAFAAGVGMPMAHANSLAELGFPGGITLQGSRAQGEVFFPLPANPVRPELELRITPSPMLDNLSSVQVLANDVPVGSIAYREGMTTTTIPIPPALARSEFLRVRFQGDQALQRDVLCFDNDTPSVWSHISAESRLNVGSEGEEGVGVVWRRLAGEVGIALPISPSLQDIEAALSIAVAIVQRGATPVMLGPSDPSARVVIGRGGAPLSVEPRPAGGQRLRVADTAAARALVTAATTMRVVPTAIGAGAPLSVATGATEAVTFADLRIGRPEVNVFSEGTMEFEIPFTNLPAGRRPVALRLFGRGPVMPPGNAMSVTLRVGDRIIWSETYRDLVSMEGVLIRLPAEFTQHRMRLRLRLARIGFRPACDSSFVYQLSGASQILLAEGWAPPTDFNSFFVSGDRPALVRIDAPANEAVAAIPALATLLARSGGRAQAIEVSTGTRLDRPFLVLSRAAPSEVEARGLLRPDLGRIILQDERTGARAEVSPAAGLSVVQVVQASSGAPGLWISPGSERSFATPAVLSEGNVAVLDGTSLPAVFDTRAPRVSAEESRLTTAGGGALSFLSSWRNELFIAGWVILTILVLMLVLRLRRRRA